VAVAVSDLELRDESYDGPVGRLLVERVQQEYVARYGGRDETPVDPAEFAVPGGRFLVGFLDGEPVACGGIRVTGPDVAELKRMYVDPAQRGRGFARLLLAALEEAARGLGCTRVQLETGDRQPEAIRLYQTSGYLPVEPFGHYRCTPGSHHFGKDLGTPAPAMSIWSGA
jgi:GNAT superfamily N-acetyltransferase